MAVAKHRPVLIVIAGPNGSGKTTITSKILRHEWLQQMEQALQQPKGSNAKHHYRHEALCGMFKSDATEAELVEEYLTEKYNL